ncbi:Uncharacterised protein [Legionella lansingensis]|uniref:Uncharacterized protein n=1 Tax=Legionella lansingensis TaxID=45067 RepID=A0A0W0VPS4_9GAMM|nr:hypothetical protein [Legionella lansingensis]KTD22072.1 hypothetical protein Llan_1335 [Legionella lansingensis]SNV54277.1 Uncharacterised protein [Legionella lansingensis]
MLVSRVHEFISALVSIEQQLGTADKALLIAFQTKYPLSSNVISEQTLPERDPNDSLSEEELCWIRDRFAERWKEIADKQDDYTFDPRGNNVEWIRLAKDLALELKQQHYFVILIPVITNKSDPDNFSRLEQDQDPRSIYLSDDGTWHRIQGLFERLQQPAAVFLTYDHKKTNPRALTLKEMFRIRSKKGDELAKQIDNEIYANFWDYLIRRIAPTWQQKGKCPEHLLPTLLGVIESYFDAKATRSDSGEFKKKFDAFIKELESCPLQEINHFYGIEIYGKKRNYYLIDALLDCLQSTEGLEEKLMDVARWLCRRDPTLISQCKNLMPIYETLKVGQYLDVTHLTQLVSKLDLGIEPVRHKVKQLIKALQQTGQITEEIIQNIKEIYRLRWEHIIDSPKDYLRKQDGENRSWIRLAQYLAGAGFIDGNYYKLLIPTLKRDTDPVTLENITSYPLSYFILSEDQTELIYLPNCVRNHQSNGTFYCCTADTPRMLSTKELSRLPFAAVEVYEYYLQVVANEEIAPPISKRTVLALRDLVNGTLNPKALRLGHKITKDQEKIAEASYLKFAEFVNALPADEFARLYAHTVVWRGQKKRVSEIIAAIQDPNEDPTENSEGRECIAVASQFFAKLVIDYDPEIKFRLDIEEAPLAALNEMRLASAKHVFRDWDHISEEEATKRALSIVVSLMTHNFSYLWLTGVPLHISGHSNTTTETGSELLKAVQLALELGDLSKMRFIYTYVINRIVEKALAQTDLKTKYTRYEDTISWLKSIKDESMFKPEKSLCFDPKLILVVLVPSLSKIKGKALVEKFLERLIQTLLQPQNDCLKWVHINIEFNKLLNSDVLSFKHRQEILGTLRRTTGPVSEGDFIQQLSNFLVHRLSALGVRNNTSQGLFGVDPGVYNLSFKAIKGLLHRSLSMSHTIDATQKDAINKVFALLRECIQHPELFEANSALCDYLDSFDKKRVTIPKAEKNITVPELPLVQQLF